MNILVTNDDGVDNPGIWTLVRAVKNLGSITVVAPATNQSGMGAALSFRKSVAVNECESQVAGVPCYAVDGTPGDSVVIGIKHVLNDRVDAVVSGINPGSNTSRNLLISGTMGAASIACSNGIKAAAFSMAVPVDFDDPLIGKITAAITEELISSETPDAALFNINYPSFQAGEIVNAEGCAPTPSLHHMKLEQHDNGGFEIMSRLAVHRDGTTLEPGTDLEVLDRGRVAITALNGNNLCHIPGDPSLQRMIAAANRAIG